MWNFDEADATDFLHRRIPSHKGGPHWQDDKLSQPHTHTSQLYTAILLYSSSAFLFFDKILRSYGDLSLLQAAKAPAPLLKRLTPSGP